MFMFISVGCNVDNCAAIAAAMPAAIAAAIRRRRIILICHNRRCRDAIVCCSLKREPNKLMLFY